MEHYFTNNDNLKSEIKNINYSYNDKKISFFSDNGVFSKNKVDFGSRLLVETFLASEKEVGNVLDVGCGYGFIGIVISKIKNCYVEMIDVNKRAIHLALRNIKENNVNAKAYLSNIYENVNKQYKYIITNPPIRAGKEVVLKILNDAFDHLEENGSLWFVIRKDQGAKSTIKYLEKSNNCEIICKNKGFYIIKAKKR